MADGQVALRGVPKHCLSWYSRLAFRGQTIQYSHGRNRLSAVAAARAILLVLEAGVSQSWAQSWCGVSSRLPLGVKSRGQRMRAAESQHESGTSQARME